MFHTSDLKEKVGATERFSTSAPESDVATIFPGITIPKSNDLFVSAVVMCNSFPTRNKRGRGFMPRVIANSVASVSNSLVDIEHLMKDAGAKEDNVCGHIFAAKFDPSGDFTVETASSIPTESHPLFAGLALYKRLDSIVKIVSEHKKRKNWSVSMECAHDWLDACFLHEGEIIPLKDADSDMLECVEKESVRDYKGRELTVLLGGLDGSVNYNGIGLTRSPADVGANMGTIYTGMDLLEVASVNNKPAPLKILTGKQLTNREAWSIKVIGQTEESGGHRHDILSNGTIVPVNGHGHYLNTFDVEPGREPVFSGVTGEHTDRMASVPFEDAPAVYNTHLHSFSVKLKTKNAKKAGDVTLETSNLTTDDEMKIDDIGAKLDTLMGSLKGESEFASVKSEVASLVAGIKELNSEQELASAVEEGVKSKLASGEFVTKEAADTMVLEAVEENTKVLEEKNAEDLISQSRKDRIEALNIDLSSKTGDENSPTVLECLKGFPVDDAGNAAFEMFFTTLKANLETNIESTTTPEVEPTPAKEAASFLSKTPAPKTPATGKKRTTGKHAFSSVNKV